MNYSQIIDAIQHANGFDLFRLGVAINKMLEDPKHILDFKKKLQIGSNIEYFLPEENRSVPAKLLGFKRTRVSVKNRDDGRHYDIPFYFININRVDTQVEVATNKVGLDRNEVKVGDRVGFADKQEQDVFGIVKRLNQKTVTVETANAQWRVAYQYLFKVLSVDADALEHK